MVGEGANFQDVVSLSPPYPNLFGKTGLYKAACYALSPCLMEAKDWEMQLRKGEAAIGSTQTGILSAKSFEVSMLPLIQDLRREEG